MRIGYIYRVKNLKTGNFIPYVGLGTSNKGKEHDVDKIMNDCLRSKIMRPQDKNRPISVYIEKKGGIKNFTCVPIKRCEAETWESLQSDLERYEDFYCRKYNTYIFENKEGLNALLARYPYSHTLETRKRISESLKEKYKDPEHIEKLKKAQNRPDVKDKIKRSLKKRWSDPELRKKASIRSSEYQRKNGRVVCARIAGEEQIKIFPYITDFAKHIHRERNSALHAIKRDGLITSSDGVCWQVWHKDQGVPNVVDKIIRPQLKQEGHGKRVESSKDGHTWDKEYNSIAEAAEDVGGILKFSTSITRCCNGKGRMSAGRYWRYCGDINWKKPGYIPGKKVRSVKGGASHVFVSCREAADELKRKYGVTFSSHEINKVMRGVIPHHKGWVFEYA